MDSNRKNDLREKMEGEIEALRKDILGLEESVKPIEPSVSLGRLTRMEAIVSKGVNEAALGDARAKLEKLEKALEKIEGSGYGLCTVCGAPIPPARLEFMPEATTCVKCASF